MKRIAAASLWLALGSVQAVAAAAPQTRVTLRTPDRLTQARLTESGGVSGPSVRLRNEDDTTLQGRAYKAPVKLNLQPGRVDGVAGGHPADLTLARSGPTLRAQGEFAGKVSDLQIAPNAIAGRIGHCDYDLVASAGTPFTGFRTCEGNRVLIPTTVEIPPVLNERPDEVRAAILAVMLYR